MINLHIIVMDYAITSKGNNTLDLSDYKENFELRVDSHAHLCKTPEWKYANWARPTPGPLIWLVQKWKCDSQ